MKVFLPVCLTLLSFMQCWAQVLKGRVTDAISQVPVGGVAVLLSNSPFGIMTDREGYFTLPVSKPGIYRVRAELLGYSAVEQEADLMGALTVELNFSLKPALIQLNQEVVVTAQRYETEAFTRPEAISVLGQRELRQRVPRSVPEALTGTTGIFLQKTNHGGGSPFIRGLTGQQTLLMVDGIRMNNTTFRSGPNQYLNTIDPQSVKRIEVVRGAGSVSYGSDALGGVVQVLTKTPQFSEELRIAGSGLLKYGSQDMEKSGRAELSLSKTNVALLGGIAYYDFGDIRAGGKLGFLRPTGYTQFSGDLKARFRLTNRYLITIAHQQLTQNRVPLFHRVQLENFQFYQFDPQQRRLSYARAEAFYNNKWLKHLSLTGSLQYFGEGRQSRRNGSPVTTHEEDKTHTWGGILSLDSEPAPYWRIQSGVEYYYDKVNSTRNDVDETTGSNTSKRGLYPDGSTAASLALYSLHTYNWERLTLTAGGRFNAYQLTVKEEALGTSTIRPSAIVGNLGASYTFLPGHRITASVNSAFRAPNVDDLGTLGIVDFRYEIPNTRLSPEKSINLEIGWKVKRERVSASVAAYYSRLTNIIGRIRSGSDSLQGYPVYLKENVAKAFIRGLEADGEFALFPKLAAYGSLVYTYGQNQTANEPFRRIPPLYGRAGLYYQPAPQFWGRLETLFAGKQSRLAKADIDDNRITDTGTPGWGLLNASGGYSSKWLEFSVELHNLLNEQYRTHGSGVDGMGRSAWLAVRVLF